MAYIYFILSSEGSIRYIGQTVNPVERESDHRREARAGEADIFVFKQLPWEMDADSVEMSLVNYYNPKLNVKRRLPDGADMRSAVQWWQSAPVVYPRLDRAETKVTRKARVRALLAEADESYDDEAIIRSALLSMESDGVKYSPEDIERIIGEVNSRELEAIASIEKWCRRK